MTEQVDKDRIERLEAAVRGLRDRLDDLERTVYVIEAEIRRLFEEADEAHPPM